MITLMFGAEARAEVLKGMHKLYLAVSKTAGPSGRCTVIQDRDQLYVTKDGASTARYIASQGLMDMFERAGATLLRKASQKAEEDAGDGTTAATVFAYELATRALKYVDEHKGANVIRVKKGMEKALKKVEEFLKELGTPAKKKEDWRNVAFISSQDEEIADMIADAMDKVGPEGHIRVEKGDDWKEHDMELEVRKGMEFDRGFRTPLCITDLKKRLCHLTDVPVLVTDLKLTKKKQYDQLQAICNGVITELGQRQIVLIALQFAPTAEEFIALNNTAYNESGGTQAIRILAFDVPGYGSSYTEEFAGDIAALTGATLISETQGTSLDDFNLKMLGRAEIVESDRKTTRIINQKADQEAIDRRLAEIESVENNKPSELEKRRMKERRSSLTTGMAVITVGGHLDLAVSEKKDRVDDAVLSAKCAFEEGILPGGGVAFIRAIEAISDMEGDNEDEEVGIRILEQSLEAPIRMIASNCGIDNVDDIVHNVKAGEENMGYDFSESHDQMVDLMEAGIVDPVKVCNFALRHGMENAGVFLIMETIGVTVPVDAHNRPIIELIRGDAAERIAQKATE